MNLVFDDNPKIVELVLRTVLQKELHAVDTEGKHHNVEIKNLVKAQMKEGVSQGSNQKIMSVIQKLLSCNTPIEDILDIVNLSVDKVNELINSLKVK